MEQCDRRPDLGVGTIVDTRRGRSSPVARFGLSLGFLQTFWPIGDIEGGWHSTLSRAAHASRVARDRYLAEASVLRLYAAQQYGATRDLADLSEFYRKRCPLAAGISNVNLNRDWPSRVHPMPLLNYQRISPTGPTLPIVFTPTTLGTTLNVGFTYRTGDVTTDIADSILTAFIDRLAQLQ